MFQFNVLFASIFGLALVTTGCTMQGEEPSVTPDAGDPEPACSDGVDNDHDGKIDTADPGCVGPSDNDETDAPPTDAGVPTDGTQPPMGYPWSITCPASSDAQRITTGVQWYAITANTPVGAPVSFATNGSGNRVAPATATSVTVLWDLRWEDFTKGPAWWLAHVPTGCVCNLSWPGVVATQPAYWLAGGEGGFGCNIDGRNRHTLPQ